MLVLRALSVILLSSFLMGATCHRSPDVILSEGPKATELGAAKDEQIKGLKAQVIAEQAARVDEQRQASLAAANFDGVLFAADHLEAGLPRTAVTEEAKLGLSRSPTPDPVEVIKSKDRVIAILQNEVAKAKGLYEEASGAAKQARQEIVTKDKAILEAATAIDARETRIAVLTQEKTDEEIAHKADVEKALTAKDQALNDLKAEYDSREHKWWVNALRATGLGFVVIGVLLMVVLKAFTEGGMFVGAGLLVGVTAIGVDMLTSQKWFPYAFGGAALLILAGGIWMLYRAWQTKTLHAKTTAALQDIKDESALTGSDLAAKVDEHLDYRMGDPSSFWRKVQAKATAASGLINPKAETPVVSPVKP